MDEKIVRFLDTIVRASDSEEMTVEGYALKFDKEAIIGGSRWGWREKISRTALDGAKLDDVVLNFNHSMSDILAATRNKSLQLITDNIGLKITAKVADTTIGRDVYRLIKDGLIGRMSFAAIVKKSVWTFVEDDSDEKDLREITEFERLYDVSAVTFPAYEDTSITARGNVTKAEIEARQKQIYDRQIERLNKILKGDVE